MTWLLALVGLLPLSLIKSVSRLRWRSPVFMRLLEKAADLVRHQDGRILRGAGRGLLINPGASHAGYRLGTSEPLIQETLERLLRPGMTVYDIGANAGFLSLIAARLVGGGGRVICFEPLPENAALVAHNAALNGFAHISVRREALGREDRPARFLVSAVPSWSRLESCGAPKDQVSEMTVALRRLDSIVEEAALPSPGFLKIDVEGAEVDVLLGAARLLERLHPLLLIEVHGTNKPLGESLAALGYRAEVIDAEGGLPECPWGSHVVARGLSR